MTDPHRLNRRSFLQWSAVLAGVAGLGGVSLTERTQRAPGALFANTLLSPGRVAHAAGLHEESIIQTSCSNNCGGRCILMAHVRDGVLTRIDTDPAADLPDSPQLRACLRGRSYRQIVYHPDRLKYPLKRSGPRGSGQFQRIGWDEATTLVADQVRRVTAEYGPLAIYPQYASGVAGINNGVAWVQRLLGLYGGDWLNYYGTYSSGQTRYATPFTYGTGTTGNMREDWANSKLIILMGHNPGETVFGTNSMFYLRKAKEAGARIISIDPRYTDTAVAIADEWIPTRPGTDAALMSAMAYVIVTEGLVDQAFLDTHTVGFDEQHMPDGIPAGNSYKSYLLGESDGTPKTPEWAASITGIPADRVRQLGREYGSIKPAALIQGFGVQRQANGEQTVRANTVLPSLTGNVGIHGGWAGGVGGDPAMPAIGGIPSVGGKTKISCFMWTDAIVRGTEMNVQDDLIQGANSLPSNIKLIFNLAGNALVNQHSDINRTTRILSDETLCEFIVTSDLFMTPSARWSDLVLPAPTFFERQNIVSPWNYGEYLLYMPQILAPMYETRNDDEWLTDVADKLGIKDAFTEGKTMDDWLRQATDATAKTQKDFPGYDAFKQNGSFRLTLPQPAISFEKFRADPIANKLGTPSGMIEIFSKALYDRGVNATNPDRTLDVVPAIPKYVASFDGLLDPKKAQYPLQLTGFHYKRRVHSTHDNNPWMTEMAPQVVWINPIDADARGIHEGDQVRLFNDRGATLVPAKVTPRVMPGVLALPQGAWHQPRWDGVDTNGSINTLTTQRGSYMSNSNPQHTNLVEAARA